MASLCNCIRKRPGELSLHHVRSHVKWPGNELADWLAEMGRGDINVRQPRAEAWLSAWCTRHARETAARAPGNLGNRVGVG